MQSMIHVRSIKPIGNFEVLLQFSNGEQRVVDLEPPLRGPIFEPIRNDLESFRTVRVDEELGTIAWSNGADIDPDVLYGSHVPAWMEDEEDLSEAKKLELDRRLEAYWREPEAGVTWEELKGKIESLV